MSKVRVRSTRLGRADDPAINSGQVSELIVTWDEFRKTNLVGYTISLSFSFNFYQVPLSFFNTPFHVFISQNPTRIDCFKKDYFPYKHILLFVSTANAMAAAVAIYSS